MKNNSIGLKFSGVSHSYDKAKVLHDVSLAVPSGSITCLLGPSGCGKTTLLRLSAGLEPLQMGEIFLDGEKVADAHGSLAPEKRGVGLMFQEYMLFPHLSVMDNVRFGLSELSRTEQIARAKIALEQVGMTDFSQHFFFRLNLKKTLSRTVFSSSCTCSIFISGRGIFSHMSTDSPEIRAKK